MGKSEICCSIFKLIRSNHEQSVYRYQGMNGKVGLSVPVFRKRSMLVPLPHFRFCFCQNVVILLVATHQLGSSWHRAYPSVSKTLLNIYIIRQANCVWALWPGVPLLSKKMTNHVYKTSSMYNLYSTFPLQLLPLCNWKHWIKTNLFTSSLQSL